MSDCNGYGEGVFQGRFPFARQWDQSSASISEMDHEALCETVRVLVRLFGRMIDSHVALTANLESTSRKLDDLTQQYPAITAALQRRSVIDDDVKRYRREEFKNDILGPMLRTLILILDRTERDSEQVRSLHVDAGLARSPMVTNALKWVLDARDLDRLDILNVLASFEVEVFRTARYQTFDPLRHALAGKKYAGDSKQAGLIAQSVRAGYIRRRDGWVLRPEQVAVYVTK